MKNIFFFIMVIFTIQLPAYSLSITDKLKRGEVLIEDNVSKEAKSGSVKMSFIVNSSTEKVWKLLIDYDKWTAFMDDLEKIQIKESKENYAIVYVKAKAPLGLDIHYTLRRNYDKSKYKITWTMIEGKAKEVEGSWQIFPIDDNSCKLVYTNYVDIGYMVPAKVVNLLTRNKLPNLANNIRKFLKNNN